MTPLSARIIVIDDPADERIAAYRDVRERDLVGRRGLFVAEGQVVLRNLLATPLCRTLSVLVDARRIPALEPLLETLDAPIYAAPQALLDSITGFHLHRGILAIGERTAVPTARELVAGAPKQAPLVFLSGISNHDNMGGIFRNAAAFGAAGIVIDSTCCDPLYRKAIRVSVGAALRVPFARLEEGGDFAGLAASHGRLAIALSPRGGRNLRDWRPEAPVALILGSEGEGLPQEIMDRCERVSILMAEGFDSLNVATTSGIVLHHFRRP
jgi:tRNA G18 (ribose-2'-O)-methylase SpoU